ncbi:hypothetical protein TorRG33x02_284240 [Trema orientale]|uniref:Uncharacterized protein n=1 Tax=Trema orientale TaxID=63057 RepID=A0A2P5CI66_TREOI|nr:hypothetical protein TorRG33x02_284240 [Trema orientale]
MDKLLRRGKLFHDHLSIAYRCLNKEHFSLSKIKSSGNTTLESSPNKKENLLRVSVIMIRTMGNENVSRTRITGTLVLNARSLNANEK